MTANVPKPIASRKTAGLPPFFPVLIAGLVFSAIIMRWDVDLRIARGAYAGDGAWRYATAKWVLLLYKYGTWPALIVGVLGAFVWLGSRFKKKLQPYAWLGGFCALLLVFGPGLIVNTVLKQNYGRPRPAQVAEFGGSLAFAPVLKPKLFQHAHSFPSGHASMGFYWLGLFVFYYARNRRLACGFLVLGLVHGGFMGWGRILQGSHWFSDVLWSALVVYLAAWILCCGARLLPARWRGCPMSTHDQPVA